MPLASTLRDSVVPSADALAGTVSARRVEVTAGKFAASDVFDLNRYANSTRTQFLDWVLFNNGAWDYAADTRGYSNGVTAAWINPGWTLRTGTFQMPTFANGNRFDGQLASARGDNVELTVAAPHDATLRVLAYVNHARMGRYAAATSSAAARGITPDVVSDDAPGRTKYGFAANAELPLSDDGNTGIFGRLGWNDGRNESFVFTEVDRHLSSGMQVSGARWRRSDDVFGIAIAVDGLSTSHRAYLAAGGHGFLLGDGALSYAPETISEAYYRLQFGAHVAVSPDAMLIVNPGYNRARGPAAVLTARVRVSN
jgi:carbohydrate-selective porin OprB